MIQGERLKYEKEKEYYDEAIKLDPQYAEAYWYRGLALSYEINKIEEKASKKKVVVPKDKTSGMRKRIFADWDTAIELNQFQPWVYFDYACELIHSGNHDRGISMLEKAVSLNSLVRERIKSEEYLHPALDDPRVKKLIGENG